MLPPMDFGELNDAMAESNRRARRGRTVARLMFILTATLVAFVVYAFAVAQPACMCPMFQAPPELFGQPFGLIIEMAGSVGVASGLFWMWRIVRADLDPDARSWRYLHRP